MIVAPSATHHASGEVVLLNHKRQKPESMSTYDISSELPATALISDLRYSLGQYGQKNKFAPAQVEALKKRGIVSVSDLSRYSNQDLRDIPTIGYESARRLSRAAKSSSVEMRGTGFPYELKVSVPDHYVACFLGLEESVAVSAASELLFGSLSDGAIFEAMKELKKQRIRSKIEELEAMMEAVESEGSPALTQPA